MDQHAKLNYLFVFHICNREKSCVTEIFNILFSNSVVFDEGLKARQGHKNEFIQVDITLTNGDNGVSSSKFQKYWRCFD